MENITLNPRLLVSRLQEALADTPVVLVTGPRQAGKTTLVRHLAGTGMRYSRNEIVCCKNCLTTARFPKPIID